MPRSADDVQMKEMAFLRRHATLAAGGLVQAPDAVTRDVNQYAIYTLLAAAHGLARDHGKVSAFIERAMTTITTGERNGSLRRS